VSDKRRLALEVVAHKENSVIFAAAARLILNLDMGAVERLAYSSLEVDCVDRHVSIDSGWDKVKESDKMNLRHSIGNARDYHLLHDSEMSFTRAHKNPPPLYLRQRIEPNGARANGPGCSTLEIYVSVEICGSCFCQRSSTI
jgi:hypothetical protein